MARENAADLDELRRLIEGGFGDAGHRPHLRVAAAADALRYLAQGHPAGKVVVTVS
jgi:hypothetical protein